MALAVATVAADAVADPAHEELMKDFVNWILLAITPFLLATIAYMLKRYSDKLDLDLHDISSDLKSITQTVAIHEEKFEQIDKMFEVQLKTCEQHADILSVLAEKLDNIAFNCVMHQANRRSADKIARPAKVSQKLLKQQLAVKKPEK
jgi:hypothetical protein